MWRAGPHFRFVAPAALVAALVASSCGDDASPPTSNGKPADVDAAAPAVDGGARTDAAAPDSAVDAGPRCSGKLGKVGDRSVAITSGGRQRSFDLHVPATVDPNTPAPLVFVFHGYTMTPASIAAASHFATTADARGMIVAFPAGTNGGFNAGDCCGSASTTNVDDLGFARDVLARLEADYCVDPKRVFSTGFSNGGYLSYFLACEAADRFAAVASVSGVLGVDPAACAPKRPVPLLHIHGTGDLVLPYTGGGFANARSVETSVAAFRTKNSCPAGDGKVTYKNGDVSCTTWAPCAASADVQLCTVTGGGHQWPGGDTLPFGGTASPDLKASEAIADFFEAHPMP